MTHVVPLCYWAEFSSVDISCQSSTNWSESTPNSKIWEPLVLADKIREVLKSRQNLVLQRGDHMAHVVPPLLLGRIFKCGYLVPIEYQPVGINAKQQDLGASGLG